MFFFVLNLSVRMSISETNWKDVCPFIHRKPKNRQECETFCDQKKVQCGRWPKVGWWVEKGLSKQPQGTKACDLAGGTWVAYGGEGLARCKKHRICPGKDEGGYRSKHCFDQCIAPGKTTTVSQEKCLSCGGCWHDGQDGPFTSYGSYCYYPEGIDFDSIPMGKPIPSDKCK